MPVRVPRTLSLLLLLTWVAGCDADDGDTPADPAPQPPVETPDETPCEAPEPTPAETEVLRPRSRPVEFVGLTVTRPIDAEAFAAFAGPLFGPAAREGQRHSEHELQPGLFLTVEEDPRTDEQVIIRLDMVSPGDEADRRTVFRAPASFAYGALFIDAVQAALAQAARVREEGGGEPFWLEYRVRSPNGGNLDLRLSYEGAEPLLSLTTHTPQTSLMADRINQPAFEGEPYETLAGTVWFELGRDQFDFFVERAYGITDSAGQNFADFQLKPHDWLRLTVTPELTEKRVDVAFEVMTTDGRRLALARAPASYVAGDLFKQAVLRMVDNMLDQEAEQPGSSTAWTVPFHYDDPEGGGVVRVVAQGQGGIFRIAYAVESPVNRLRAVDFVPYAQVFEIPDAFPEVETDCAEFESEPAAQGYFELVFDASTTVRNSRNLEHPLRGPIWGSVFRASDVVGTGPREGARAVASFHFDDVDLTDPQNLAVFPIDEQLLAGDYQILGFIDIDGNADPDDPDPDVGDPVTIPIGSYPLECARQRTRVEFAILRP